MAVVVEIVVVGDVCVVCGGKFVVDDEDAVVDTSVVSDVLVDGKVLVVIIVVITFGLLIASVVGDVVISAKIEDSFLLIEIVDASTIKLVDSSPLLIIAVMVFKFVSAVSSSVTSEFATISSV